MLFFPQIHRYGLTTICVCGLLALLGTPATQASLPTSEPISALAATSTAAAKRCAMLALKLREIQAQYRRGYSIKQQLKLQQQQARLELQWQQDCSPAAPDTSVHPTPRNRDTGTLKQSVPRQSVTKQSVTKQAATTPARQANSSTSPGWQASQVIVKSPYQGAQQTAWLAYYQSPFFCYNVRETSRIRQCVELRQQARQQFELWWRQQNLSDQ